MVDEWMVGGEQRIQLDAICIHISSKEAIDQMHQAGESQLESPCQHQVPTASGLSAGSQLRTHT